MATQASTELPWEIRDVEPHEFKGLEKSVTNDGEYKLVRVGPKGYLLTDWYKEKAVNIYTMPISSSDVFVTSYPRSGTTWTQELVWMVANNLDYAESKAVLLTHRYELIEDKMFTVYNVLQEKYGGLENAKSNVLKREHLGESPSARFFKTHLPLSLLPPTLVDTAKVVYVARDPRDVFVSFYYASRLVYIHTEDIKHYWNCFINELTFYQPYFEHVKEAWQKRHHPNMLFLFYEDMSKDLPAVVRRVADFFGKQFTEEQVTGLCSHLSFQNFKENKSVNNDILNEVGKEGEEKFVRKGKAGGWREYFDEEMTQQAARWIEDNLRGSDLRYPHMDQQGQ